MSQPHKHRDLIIAWANGETIQFKCSDGSWVDETDTPEWFDHFEYRIKPISIKREGWVALYGNGYDGAPSCCGIYGNETECQRMNPFAVKTVRVEWEEAA